jgi:hypothetical protein
LVGDDEQITRAKIILANHIRVGYLTDSINQARHNLNVELNRKLIKYIFES